MKRFFVVVVMVFAGCDAAHREHGTAPDGGTDAPPVVTCGTTTCDEVPPASCVDGDTLREYAPECAGATCSYPATDTECGAAGCCGDRCCTLAASNADTTGAPMPTGLVIAPPNGTFDTDTQCIANSALGQCSVVARADLPDACVCRMDELTIGTLQVTGSRALVILAHKSVLVQTTLDVSGDEARPGPGARGDVYAMSRPLYGGGGGSFGTLGANGSSSAETPPDVYGDEALVPLHGGMNGQDGGDEGGGGGGALQITAGAKIEVAGNIFAGGGGGESGYASYSSSGGGGGGSGGAILLEAPAVIVTGKLNANGGGGGGGGGTGGSGWRGEDGYDDYPSGGSGNDGSGCPLYGYVSGGDGGNGAARMLPPSTGQASDYDSRCIGSAAFVGGGGGGGGLGRVRINTITGCQCNGDISPVATFGTLGVL